MLRFIFLSFALLLVGCHSTKKHKPLSESAMTQEALHFQTHMNLIKTYLQTNQASMALTLIEPLLAEHPEAPELYNLKGVALDHMREHAEAQKTYEEGLAKFKGDVTLTRNLALSRKVMVKGQ